MSDLMYGIVMGSAGTTAIFCLALWWKGRNRW